jgi:hypothetical protein
MHYRQQVPSNAFDALCTSAYQGSTTGPRPWRSRIERPKPIHGAQNPGSRVEDSMLPCIIEVELQTMHAAMHPWSRPAPPHPSTSPPSPCATTAPYAEMES